MSKLIFNQITVNLKYLEHNEYHNYHVIEASTKQGTATIHISDNCDFSNIVITKRFQDGIIEIIKTSLIRKASDELANDFFVILIKKIQELKKEDGYSFQFKVFASDTKMYEHFDLKDFQFKSFEKSIFVKIPLSLKDKFKKQLKCAKWDGVRGLWQVPEKKESELNDFINNVNQ